MILGCPRTIDTWPKPPGRSTAPILRGIRAGARNIPLPSTRCSPRAAGWGMGRGCSRLARERVWSPAISLRLVPVWWRSSRTHHASNVIPASPRPHWIEDRHLDAARRGAKRSSPIDRSNASPRSSSEEWWSNRSSPPFTPAAALLASRGSIGTSTCSRASYERCCGLTLSTAGSSRDFPRRTVTRCSRRDGLRRQVMVSPKALSRFPKSGSSMSSSAAGSGPEPAAQRVTRSAKWSRPRAAARIGIAQRSSALSEDTST